MKVLIIGAGKTGMELFYIIVDEPGVALTGIVDAKNEFSGFDMARTRNIPVFTDIFQALRTTPDVVFYLEESGFNVTEILAHKAAHTEIVESQGISFFLNLIRHSRLNTIRQLRQGNKLIKETPVADSVLPQPDLSTSATNTIEHVFENKPKQLINILCIDNDETFLQSSLRNTLEPAGYKVDTAQKGWDGMEKSLNQRPDLIILDPVISEKDSFQLFQDLKSKSETKDIPIIIITTKNLTVGERLAFAGKIEGMMHKNYFTGEDLLSHIHDLEIGHCAGPDLLDKASTLFNKPYFQIRLAQEISRADRHSTFFSILMAQIDGFRDYAQVWGINNYNACIRKIGDFLKETSRGSDVSARYGMGGFAMILTSTNEEGTQIVARRLLSFIEKQPFSGMQQFDRNKLTISIVTVHYDHIGPCVSERMISEAQKLIREAEKSGGGNIKIYGMNQPLEIDDNLEQVFSRQASAIQTITV